MTFWDKVTDIQKKQQAKGLETYGQTLEQNTLPSLETRLQYLEEELVDALMYIEWIKSELENACPWNIKDCPFNDIRGD